MGGGGKGAPKGGGRKGVCFDMRDHNTCSKGDQCPYSHDREELRAARRNQQEQRQATIEHDVGKTGQKGKGKGKKGKGKWTPGGTPRGGTPRGNTPTGTPRGKGKGKGKGKGDRKHILCKFVKEGKDCPAGGEQCQYSQPEEVRRQREVEAQCQ